MREEGGVDWGRKYQGGGDNVIERVVMGLWCFLLTEDVILPPLYYMDSECMLSFPSCKHGVSKSRD